MLRCIPALVLLIGLSVSISADDTTLKVGDPAPALSPGKWVKGDPIKEIQKGRVHVVEFWATWCGPCIQSIPHLSALSKKHKDVIFIGQSVWEQEPEKVEPFVKQMGEKMDYHVAMDDLSGGEPGKMASAWMTAAGRDGIPTAFIVGKESTIVWIGHPMEMDEVLDKVVKGTYDSKVDEEKTAKLQAVQDRLNSALQNKDWDSSLAILDELQKLETSSNGQIDFVRFNILLQKKDFDPAYKLAARIVDEQKDNAEGLNAIAWTIVDPENPVDVPDLTLAEKAAQQAVDASKGERGDIIDTLARVYYLQKKLDKAIETQTKAVEKAPDDETRQEMQKALNEYKKPR